MVASVVTVVVAVVAAVVVEFPLSLHVSVPCSDLICLGA